MSMPGSRNESPSAACAGRTTAETTIRTRASAALMRNERPVFFKIEIGIIVGRVTAHAGLARSCAVGPVARVLGTGAVTGFALDVGEIDGRSTHAPVSYTHLTLPTCD